jgi:hypothetical protein
MNESTAQSGAARIVARYWIETAYPLASAAATMAGEQSTGTFLRVPGETDELRERHAAVVECIVEGEPANTPSLPGSGTPKNWDGVRRTAEVRSPGRSTTSRRHGSANRSSSDEPPSRHANARGRSAPASRRADSDAHRPGRCSSSAAHARWRRRRRSNMRWRMDTMVCRSTPLCCCMRRQWQRRSSPRAMLR